MLRVPSSPRPDWQARAKEFGFVFHTMYGQPYWDETAYYQFTLEQIENHIEDPTAEIHQMCLHAVDKVVKDEVWLKRFQIPELYWDLVHRSWTNNEPSLYSRLDLAYHGQGPAKLYENNADTPTSLYESGFWQWLWLEDLVDTHRISKSADQFNSLQEKLIRQLKNIAEFYGTSNMHFACCEETDEDRGTVQYLQDCAKEAGLTDFFNHIETLGIADTDYFTDLQDRPIELIFKLYPWEFMFREEFGSYITHSPTHWVEPAWKSILSNKALMPLLWQLYPNHPNLLPAYFEDELHKSNETKLVKKPIFSREGANISVLESGQVKEELPGPYGEEGFIYQAYYSLPQFGDNHTLIGSWLVNDEPAGISVREDVSPITQDLSRYLPHIIL